MENKSQRQRKRGKGEGREEERSQKEKESKRIKQQQGDKQEDMTVKEKAIDQGMQWRDENRRIESKRENVKEKKRKKEIMKNGL